MDHLAPELAVVLFAVLLPQPPHLVEAQVDHLAPAVGPNGDERLMLFAVGAQGGGMLGQHGRLRVLPLTG